MKPCRRMEKMLKAICITDTFRRLWSLDHTRNIQFNKSMVSFKRFITDKP